MDKSAGNKKSPAGSTRRAYSIFGGIINLAHHQQQSHTPKSNVLSTSSSVPGNVAAGAAAAGVAGGGTSLDPQGSSANVYTVTVTNSENPDNTNQVKTFENRVPLKKQKGDQSTSTSSSLTPYPYTTGMNSNSSSSGSAGGGGGTTAGAGKSRIGPAPRTLSILTALNELAISDKIEPNPTCSQPTPPVSTGNNQTRTDASRSSNAGINNVSSSAISKSNPSHSSCHYPPKRNVYSGNIHHQHQQQGSLHGNKTEQRAHEGPAATNMATSTSSALHEHHLQQYTSAKNVAPVSTEINTSVYHSASACSTRGLYSTNAGVGGVTASSKINNARLTKGYNERLGAPALPPPLPLYGNTSAGKFSYSPASAATSTLPALSRQTESKSRGSHKESSARRGAAKQRDRSKSQTPDWIWKIFQLTKHGKLEELKQSLLGLDPTLIRHLADAKGNTVLHCAARGGHVNTLQWLVSVLGSQCTEAALNDHNQAGRTVILTALKKGQLQCLQWLVQNTKCGEKTLVPNDGERSLLHHAATQGDLNVVRWLCTELIDKGISVDIRDAGGMTPLHDAAKSGHITVCHELILAGADPLSQTELGWRPSDLAIRHRHTECASYFMVAEAAGSLGNQLYSLLLAFNHLRQEHEELRSHFRETLRVGKWLAKERNDLIKHFPSKWTLDSGGSSPTAASGGSSSTGVSSPPSLLLGGANNGTRFSDLEHKLVLAEQAWRKISQNSDETSSESILNGEESLLPSVSSHEFLHRRLAAVQLRHERNQTLGNSLHSSGSSDEDLYQDSNSSSSDASNSDVDVERITSVTAGSHGGGAVERMMMMMVGQNSPASIHSSTVSPSQKSNSGTMRTRSSGGGASTSKAPWLLPPNDAFLSQLSPFVGAHVGKSLPTLDLLHGAPTSSTLLSPIVTPSTLSTAAASSSCTATTAAVAPTITTDTAGKNEKSLVQMDTERLGGSHAGKQDSTSLEISVLEVIEPTSHASPASSSFKKNLHQTPDLICGMQYKKRHGQKISQQQQQLLHQSLSLREKRPRKGCYYSHSEENLVGSHDHEEDAIYEPVSPCFWENHRREHLFETKSHSQNPEQNAEKKFCNSSLHKSVNALDTMATCKGDGAGRKDSSVSFSSPSPSSRNKGGNEPLQPRPSSSFSIPLSARRKKSGGDNEQQQTRKLADASRERTCDNEILCYSGTDKVNFSPASPSAFGANGSLHSVVVTQDDSAYATSISSSNNTGTRHIISKSQTPSPKSYVTKLTVIPVEAASETCFLSVRSTSFAQEQDQQQQQHHQEHEKQTDVTSGSNVTVGIVEVHQHGHQEGLEESHQLHLPGDNPDELSSLAFSCQIPSYSVSSSNTPVMPRFNSSGTVVFPLRKPSSDWHSTELLSLTTPDSSLAGRLSPTPSETSRTESAFAPPPSYVSHASQNSEVSKTESARGHHYHHHHDMNEVNVEERDLESPVGGGDGALHLQSSFINHTAGNTSAPFQSIHPHPHSLETGSASHLSTIPSSQSSDSNAMASSVDTLAQKIALEAEHMNSAMGVLEMCKSDRKKNRDCSTTFKCSPTTQDHESGQHRQEAEATDTASAFSSPGTHDVVDDDDGGDHVGDNDRSAVKQRGLFEKQQQNKRISVSATTSTTRSIRSHLSTTSIHKSRVQQQQRLPKGYHHHNRGQSKPWYEIEGSDDEGSLLRVAKSRSSHSSNFSSSINPVHSSSNSPGSSTPVTSNPEESSSQNESAAEENQNNNSGAGSRATEAEQKDGDDRVQKVEQSSGSSSSSSPSSSSSNKEGAQQQNSSTTVTSNKKHNCSNFL